MARRAFGPGVASPALSGATGEISGAVTSAKTAAPIDGIEVCAYSEELFPGPCATTGSGGEYTISGLEQGSYVVEFNASLETKLDYERQYYNDAASEKNADEVRVGSGPVSGINAALEPGGEIAGTVTNTEGDTLEKIEVCALDAVEEFAERCALTNAAGEYTIVGVAAGAHDVEFAMPFESALSYATQYYDDEESLSKANAVTVSAEATTSGIDAVLSPGAQITGRVTSFASHEGLSEVEVCARPVPPGSGSRCTTTEPNGDYDLTSLNGGDYTVAFLTFGGEYAPQYYDEASSPTLASDVHVNAGSIQAGIDAALRRSVPANLTVPTISGSPVEGQTLTVAHGSWTHAPTSYQDEWGRCANSEIDSCYTVGVGDSYTLSASDVGYAIRVRESASNEGGKGQFAFSAQTATVTAATGTSHGPLVGSSLAPANGVVPAPAGGVLGARASNPSAAQSRALLAGLLVPTGKNAKIGALLKRGGYAISFKALSAGRLVISWYLVPKGAHLASAKPLLLAVGRLSFTQPGMSSFSIKLTAAGRSRLSHATQLRLTAKGVLTPNGSGAVDSTRSFTLKR